MLSNRRSQNVVSGLVILLLLFVGIVYGLVYSNLKLYEKEVVTISESHEVLLEDVKKLQGTIEALTARNDFSHDVEEDRTYSEIVLDLLTIVYEANGQQDMILLQNNRVEAFATYKDFFVEQMEPMVHSIQFVWVSTAPPDLIAEQGNLYFAHNLGATNVEIERVLSWSENQLLSPTDFDLQTGGVDLRLESIIHHTASTSEPLPSDVSILEIESELTDGYGVSLRDVRAIFYTHADGQKVLAIFPLLDTDPGDSEPLICAYCRKCREAGTRCSFRCWRYRFVCQ